MPSYKQIAKLDLASFRPPDIPGNKTFAVRSLWYVINALFFQSAFALLPSSMKAWLLRLFGARIGRGVVIKPRVSIKSPWFLDLGDQVWIGEAVWIDNHTMVRIGSNSCISQGAYIFTGNHDWNDPAFAFFCRPVVIGKGVWVTAFQRITPGTTVPSGVAVISSPQRSDS